ncbi:MAG: pyruvate kinase alpha/beta domain-containing protein [Candidatus Bathyarchaeia archaeon]
MKKSITYFERPGPRNTEETIKLSRERARELGIKDVVVASSHGGTASKVAEIFDDPSTNLVAVTICESFRDKGWTMSKQERASLESRGIKVLTGIHALGDDVSSAFTEKFSGVSINEAVRQTLYRFSQGMKVSVEIVLMAADAGLIPVDREVIAIAGTDEGADTAIVVKPSYPRKFLDFRIKEIIAKPREG